MNRFALVFGMAAAFLTPCVHAQTEQELPYLTPGDEPGQVDVNWLSVQDRTYFIQVSLDLIRWIYVPYIEFGNGETLEMTFPEVADGAVFYRLQYTDAAVPGGDPDNADFDGDGLSNIAEVTSLGTDPFNLDTDGDYSPDGEEQELQTDPLSSGSAPLILLPMARDLYIYFNWTGSTSNGVYHHNWHPYEEDPQGTSPWLLKPVPAPGLSDVTGLPVFHTLHTDLASLVPFPDPPPLWFLQQARPGTGYGAAVWECDVKDEGGVRLRHERLWVRGPALVDADLLVPVEIRTFAMPPAAGTPEPTFIEIMWLRIPAGENISEDFADALSGFDPYYPFAGYQPAAAHEYWATPDPIGWRQEVHLITTPAGDPQGYEFNIYNGQNAPKMVPDTDEETIGAFTVWNLNDTDSDGTNDLTDTIVKVTANPVPPGVVDEVDLMKLEIKGPTQGTMKVTVEVAAEGGAVKFWEKSTKETQIQLTDGKFEFPASQLPKTIWVEATAKSGAVRDILLKLGQKADGGQWNDDIDRVKATAVWAEPTGLRNQPGDAMWADAGQDLKDYFNANPGTFGPVDEPTLLLNCIGLEFTVYPAGIGSEPKVNFDITRQHESRIWFMGGGERSENQAEARDYPVGDLANDDGNENQGRDESNEPVNDHIYVVDWPGTPKAVDPVVAPHLTDCVVKFNFKEFVRVSFNGTPPSDNSLSGSRCCIPKPWHALQGLKNVGGQYAIDPDRTNEILGGNINMAPPTQ